VVKEKEKVIKGESREKKKSEKKEEKK